jgi:hypothetical protein
MTSILMGLFELCAISLTAIVVITVTWMWIFNVTVVGVM